MPDDEVIQYCTNLEQKVITSLPLLPSLLPLPTLFPFLTILLPSPSRSLSLAYIMGGIHYAAIIRTAPAVPDAVLCECELCSEVCMLNDM